MWVGDIEITKHKNQNFRWEIRSLDFVGVFSWQKKPDKEPDEDNRPCKLSEFTMHLEDKSMVNFRIECHDLTEFLETSAPGEEVQGTQVPKFELKSFEDCLFLPKGFACQEQARPGKRCQCH